MTDPATSLVPPKKILLATDLGARCDRALDRAAQLARQWQVPLVVVHATSRRTDASWPAGNDAPSWRQWPSRTNAIEQQIRRDLGDAAPKLAIHVTEGEPAPIILDIAEREQCELIVLGAADERSGQSFFGSTTECLVRKSPASVLVVKNRPHGAYRHVLVGTDFTAESRHGLDTVANWFPAAQFALMHVLDIPYSSMWLDPTRGDALARMEMATIKAFLDSAHLTEAIRHTIRPLVEHGHPESILRDYVLEHDADLTVVGAL
ncbi:MAG: universal stress protein, partial [Rhodanobacter sp.]